MIRADIRWYLPHHLLSSPKPFLCEFLFSGHHAFVMRGVKFCPFAVEGTDLKNAGCKLSCTLYIGSFQDGGVFWYSNEMIMSKTHPKDGILSKKKKKNDSLLAQVENTQLISPIIPPRSHGGGGVPSPFHSQCHFPSTHHTKLPCCCPHLSLPRELLHNRLLAHRLHSAFASFLNT